MSSNDNSPPTARADGTRADDASTVHAATAAHRVARARIRAQVANALFGDERAVHVGRFEIRSRIGSGAMGEVFEAHDPALDRLVALKLIAGSPGVSTDTLLNEARAMAQLKHPNIVAVYEAGVTDDGVVYCAMERLDGDTLAATWQAKRPAGAARDRRWQRDVIATIVALGNGLGALHERGIVHRDVKPANIIVTERGPVLVDFGIARQTIAAGGDKTYGYVAAGTPAYMAPEQALDATSGVPGDSRSDQFSLACVAFEGLTGRRPFPSEVGARNRAMNDGRIDDSLDDLPKTVRAVLTRALSAPPAERYPTVLAFVDALSKASAPASSRAIPALAVIIAVAAVLVVAIAIADPFQWRTPSPSVAVLAKRVSYVGDLELFVPDDVIESPADALLPEHADPKEIIERARLLVRDRGPNGALLASANFPSVTEGLVDTMNTGGNVELEWIDPDDVTRMGTVSVDVVRRRLRMDVAEEPAAFLERKGRAAAAFPLAPPRCPLAKAIKEAPELDKSEPFHAKWEIKNTSTKDYRLVWRVIDKSNAQYWFDAATCAHIETSR